MWVDVTVSDEDTLTTLYTKLPGTVDLCSPVAMLFLIGCSTEPGWPGRLGDGIIRRVAVEGQGPHCFGS